jgi:hypothetical protein
MIASDKTPRKLFKLFLIGSVLYIVLHYYLYSADRGEMLSKVRSYLYYAMAVDILVAYSLSSFSSDNEDKSEDDNNGKDEGSKNKGYSEQERQAIVQKLQERMWLQNKQQLLEQQKLAEQQRRSLFIKKDQALDDDENAVDKKSESKKSSDKKSDGKKEKRNKKEETDMELPIYMNNDK